MPALPLTARTAWLQVLKEKKNLQNELDQMLGEIEDL